MHAVRHAAAVRDRPRQRQQRQVPVHVRHGAVADRADRDLAHRLRQRQPQPRQRPQPLRAGGVRSRVARDVRLLAGRLGEHAAAARSPRRARSLARGIAASATLTRDKHTFTLSGSTYAGITNSTPLTDTSGFVRASTFATASRQVQFADSFKVNDKLTLGPNLSYAGTTGAGSSLLAGFSAQRGARPATTPTTRRSRSAARSRPTGSCVRYSDPYRRARQLLRGNRAGERSRRPAGPPVGAQLRRVVDALVVAKASSR